MKRMPRVLRWILGALVAFEILYVLAAVILVQSGQVERWVNKHPEKLKITFDSAWTFLPGLVHLGGVRVVNQGRGNQLEAVVDSARVFVNPFALIGKTVSARAFTADGVEFRYRKRPQTSEEAAEKAELVPPIEGAAYEPYGGPPKENKAKDPDKKGWTVDVGSATLADIREIWMGAFRLRGAGRVDASVRVETGDGTRLSIRKAGVRYGQADLTVGGEHYSKDLKIDIDGAMEPFSTKETKGPAILGLVTASVEVSGKSTGQLLNYYFGKADWLKFRTEPRQMSLKLDVDHGKIKPGGYLDLEKGPLGAEFAGFIAEGDAGARMDMEPAAEGEGADVHVKVDFSDYGMRREVDGPPIMKGAGLLIEARSPADLEKIPPDDFAGQIQLGKAEFPDLTFVNEMLPRGGGLAVQSGRGSVDGGFEIESVTECHGQVKIKTADLVLGAGGVKNDGDVEVTIEVPHGNLNDLKFGIDHTRVEFKNFDFTSEGYEEKLPPWQGRFEVTDGTLDLGDTKGVSGNLEIFFTDTRPLVAFLSKDEPMKGWKKNLLMIDKVTGESVAEMTPGTTTIRHFGIRGEKLDVRFRATLNEKGAFGKARAMYGILKAGIAIEGQQRHLKILRVGSWYKNNDIPGMPPLLKKYEEKVDLEQEEAEAAAAEEAAPAAQGAEENAGEKEGAPPPEGGAEPNAPSSEEAAPAGASRRRTRESWDRERARIEEGSPR
jgi:hypothetical protein